MVLTRLHTHSHLYNTVCIIMYCNLPKIGPPPILNVVAAEGAFLSKLRPPAHCSTCGYVRSSTVQEEEQTKWRQTPFAYVRKHIRGIAKSPHAYINRARLSSVCEVDIFSRNSTTLENSPPSSLWSSLHPGFVGGEKRFSPPMQPGYEVTGW